ncbi:MAG: bifunctional demethylmenaquinone methyltransferase/2-methoxy-6-polyprenyl-1,4-benzoquinol methylase UbiE [Verrucomicrobiota bacterium]
MNQTFYSPGEQRADRVNALFAAIARRYDLINDVQSLGLHRLWKRRLVNLAQILPGTPALDVCCGTGDISFALARAGAQTTGLDFNAPMLEVARKRANPGESNPRFVQGDALHLPFAEAEFDTVTMGYGLRNLSDWKCGLSELRRVLKPGGRVLILDFGKPDNRAWRGLWFGYLRCVLPILGRVFCGNAAAYAYVLESLEAYPAQHGVAAELRAQGFADVRVQNFLGGVMSIHTARKQG